MKKQKAQEVTALPCISVYFACRTDTIPAKKRTLWKGFFSPEEDLNFHAREGTST